MLSATNVYPIGVDKLWLPLNVLFSFALMLSLFFSVTARNNLKTTVGVNFHYSELFYLIFLLLLIFATLLFSYLIPYNINHLLSYIVPYIIYFKLYEYLFEKYNVLPYNIIKYFFYGLLLSSFIAIVEFIYGFVFFEEFMELFPFTHVNLGGYGGFLRSQSLTYEPNHFGLYLAILTPISFLFLRGVYFNNKLLAIMFVITIIMGMMTTFSASLFAVLIIDVIIIVLYLCLKLASKFRVNIILKIMYFI